MANILDRYGIKEVADVTFYEIADNGDHNVPVLVLDTLKVTSIEQTAETAEARGGKGNSKLIVWDFGKEITVTIEDALFSPKSLSLLFGDGKVTTTATSSIQRSKRMVCTSASTAPTVKIEGDEGVEITVPANSITWYEAKSDNVGLVSVTAGQMIKGTPYFACWNQTVTNASTIVVTPDSFPGTYYVTGDTMVRKESGRDEFFQFVIPKAKMQVENTINMEAEGDPSTFNMSLQILRPENGEMLQFIKYNLTA